MEFMHNIIEPGQSEAARRSAWLRSPQACTKPSLPLPRKKRSLCIVSSLLWLAGAGVMTRAATLDGPHVSLTIEIAGDVVNASLGSSALPAFASGPYAWNARVDGVGLDGLKSAQVRRANDRTLIVTGRLGPLDIEQRFTLLEDGGGFSESIILHNPTGRTVDIDDLRFGFSRKVDPATDPFRLVAVPYRRQADGSFHDNSMADIVAVVERGGKINATGNQPPVAPLVDEEHRRLRSEGWVLTDGARSLLVLKYNNEAVELSAVNWEAAQARVVFGGCAFVLHKEPVQARSLCPETRFQFGETRYVFYNGGWPEGYALYKDFLNRRGHGLAPEYDPQVQWNVLFDLSDKAWPYKKVLEQAALAKAAGCTRLYLDPGWQVPTTPTNPQPLYGSALWDEKRLGPLDEFVRLMRDSYGLEVGLWAAASVGQKDAQWPRDYYRQMPAAVLQTPPPRQRYQDLVLLPMVKSAASSALDAEHDAGKVRDGQYGNGASWIAGRMPAWIEIDLKQQRAISQINLSNDNTRRHTDRAATSFRILTATRYNVDSKADTWKVVGEYNQYSAGLTNQMEFSFPPVTARWVRIELLEPAAEPVRIDEIEIYQAAPNREKTILPSSGRSDGGSGLLTLNELCMSDREWLDERFRRLSRLTDSGVRFLMFDFHGWRGPCYAPDHGHPVPSTTLDHIDSLYGLARKLRLRHPDLRIEMHDAVWPWGARYLPGYFRQGLRGGDYDENWGYEFMWNSIGDIRSGKAACLYYYNLACDMPMYLHFNMHADNDQLLAFWWMASTVRHLGFGGRTNAAKMEYHGRLEELSPERATARFEKLCAAMTTYNRLKPYFTHGKFSGIGGDETLHLHTLPGQAGGVLLLFNLGDQPVNRVVRVPLSQLDLGSSAELPAISGASGSISGDSLVLSVPLAPESPALIAIGSAAADVARR
ncbi:MAG: discoidin domain-containing protein [Opitutaceae bacterium]|nr:discoidin domain-containing protein [Opitutaceae bacterium]